MEDKVKFSFKETEPDMSSFLSRFKHFYGVTNPANYFVPDSETLDGIKTVQKFKALAKASPDGVIDVTPEERTAIYRGIELANSSANDLGQLVFNHFRM